MLSHSELWSAIDALAHRYNLSTSGLAKRSGLDSTSFNKSKRIAPDGKPRWPSTESIAKILDATGASLDEFMELISTTKRRVIRQLPLIGLAQAGIGGFFDDGGLPVGNGWDEVNFPSIEDEQTYALEISGDSMLPLFRDGDVIIVAPSAAIRRGDRVVVKTTYGEIMAKELKRRTNKLIELSSMNPEHADRIIQTNEIEWIARIVWASQ
jgi:phage repressor protein C with HTH and peptisase S24 domain